jgi:UDP-glucose 4-epimerase
MKRVLVTGGNGFLGSHIVHELHNRGHQVNILDTMPPRNDLAHTYWNADVRHAGAVQEVVSAVKPHWVIHLAAVHYIPYCNLHPGETFDVNVKGTYNVLEALRKVERVFVASSAGVYSTSPMPHSEDGPAWPIDIYGFSKRATEEVVKYSDHPYIIGRYFNMYGWGETTPHLIPVLIEQIRDGAHYIELGNIDTRRDFIHVSDNARATVDLLEMDPRGDVTVNLGSGCSYSAKNLLNMLSKITGRGLSITVNEDRVRKADRPNLVADMTRSHSLGLPQPKISIWDGLKDLVENGVGPYLEDPLK